MACALLAEGEQMASSIRSLLLVFVPWTLGVSLPSVASACPDCAVGRAARTSVYDQDFTTNLALLALPLLVLAGLVAALHRIDTRPSDRGQSRLENRSHD